MTTHIFRFGSGDGFGTAVNAVGDFDGDGITDFAITAPFSNGTTNANLFPGDIFMVSGAHVADADAADGSIDGEVNFALMPSYGPEIYRIRGEVQDGVANSIEILEDLNGDGLAEILIGVSSALGTQSNGRPGAAYIVSLANLETADQGDGLDDNRLILADLLGFPGTWRIEGENSSDRTADDLQVIGDIDGDGFLDFIMGAEFMDTSGNTSGGGAFVVTHAALSAADGLDGTVDGQVFTGFLPGVGGSYRLENPDGGLTGNFVGGINDGDGDGLAELVITSANQPVDPSDPFSPLGRIFVISSQDLPTLDLLDTVSDGRADISDAVGLGDSYAINSTRTGGGVAGNRMTVGQSLDTGGDFDGDGETDLMFGDRKASSTMALASEGLVIVTTFDALAPADGADGTVDGNIDPFRLIGEDGTYAIYGGVRSENLGVSVSFLADMDGDGKSELLIGADVGNTGTAGSGIAAAYLVMSRSLVAADAADGTLDNIINIQNTLGLEGSYKFISDMFGLRSGIIGGDVGNIAGADPVEFLLGLPGNNSTGFNPPEAYLLNPEDFDAADAADGTVDGIIELADLVAVPRQGSFVGTSSFDTLFGTSGNEVLDGLGGDDVIEGRSGNDVLIGGDGQDFLYGGFGDDQLILQDGDALFGSEVYDGGDGYDTFIVTGGTASLGHALFNHQFNSIEALFFGAFDSGSGTRSVFLNMTDFALPGFEDGFAHDTNIIGFDAAGQRERLHISLNGDGPVDWTSLTFTDWGGQNEIVELHDDGESREITGTVVDDLIFGNAGNDIIDGAEGSDILNGGQGADVFQFSVADDDDAIGDYDVNQSVFDDVISLDPLLRDIDHLTLMLAGAAKDGTDLFVGHSNNRGHAGSTTATIVAEQVGVDTVLTVTTTSPVVGDPLADLSLTITLLGITATDLTMNDFLY